MISDNIQKHVLKALQSLGMHDVEIELEHPADEKHGDFSTNVALKTQSNRYKSSRELAEALVKELKKDDKLKKLVSKIEAKGPGFINFYLSYEYLITSMNRFIEVQDAYGSNETMKGKLVLFEFPDPNPFKEYHIGHLYDNCVGESFSRIYEALGACVKRVNYQGDVGLHVAKSIWGMRKRMKDGKVTLDELSKRTLKERVEFMGKAYALGASIYKENESARKEIEGLNKKIYDLNPEVKELYTAGRQWSLDYFETIYKRMGTKHDNYYFEREAGEVGLKYIRDNLKKGIFTKSKGAIVFKGEQYGLHTRVFVNSQGLPTYEAKDLGLAPTKYKDYKYDLSIIITANEIDEYFKVVLKALSLINPTLGKKTKHISHGIIKLPEGKMSSRTGKIITGEWLIEETKKRVLKLVSDKENKEDIAETIALGAIKYSLLKVTIGRDVVFDFKKSLSLEGNSGPYLQYTYARARSVMRKSKLKHSNSEGKTKMSISCSMLRITDHQLRTEESAILRTLYKYPEVVLEAGKTFSPNLICNYLFDLAQKFNLFYQKVPILKPTESEGKAEKEQKEFRLALTSATSQALKNGLDLLGIKVLERM